MHKTADLSAYPQFIPQLVVGLEAEWPEYVASQPPGVTERGFHSADHWIVAFEDGACLGVVAIREHTEAVLSALKPALGSLWVHPARRGEGIGTALVEAGMRLAAARGETTLYTFTNNAVGLVTRLGWRQIDTVVFGGKPLGAYAVGLNT